MKGLLSKTGESQRTPYAVAPLKEGEGSDCVVVLRHGAAGVINSNDTTLLQELSDEWLDTGSNL
eukprot:scaffold16243_cov51-Skeletonema_menzelii.AAC.1